MNKSELKPCPFCGSTDVKLVGSHTNDDCYSSYYSYRVFCRNCGARGAEKRDEEKPLAIRAWNRRVELTGEWLEDEYGYCRCSICGYEHDDPKATTPYCPNCGALMQDE